MITQETTIYKCEHCGKKQFRKCDMSRHEKWCKKKPENKHKCFQFCVYLKKDTEEIEGTGNIWEERGNVTRCTFTCEKTMQRMYSFIAERRGIPMHDGEVRMPTECDMYYGEINKLVDESFPFK